MARGFVDGGGAGARASDADEHVGVLGQDLLSARYTSILSPSKTKSDLNDLKAALHALLFELLTYRFDTPYTFILLARDIIVVSEGWAFSLIAS